LKAIDEKAEVAESSSMGRGNMGLNALVVLFASVRWKVGPSTLANLVWAEQGEHGP
jgi:hypothetical protein